MPCWTLKMRHGVNVMPSLMITGFVRSCGAWTSIKIGSSGRAGDVNLIVCTTTLGPASDGILRRVDGVLKHKQPVTEQYCKVSRPGRSPRGPRIARGPQRSWSLDRPGIARVCHA